MGIRGSTTFEIGAAANNAAAGVPPLYIPAILIQLAVFVTAGYHWRLRFYPTDVLSPRGDGRFSVSLQLMSTGATVRAVQELTVLDHAALVPPRLLSAAPPRYFAYEYGGYGDQIRHFSSAGMDLDRTSLLEQCTAYVRDGRLLLQFTVTVCPEDPGQTPGAVARIDVPPSDMLGQLGEVLERGEGSDITFLVDGELFPAHRIILAMRSSVFRAELYGEMKENGAAATVAIGDMRPDAFRALLRYIYTDASPADIISSNSNKDEGDDDGSEA
ncbi:hypothetical protein C2845_PM13G07030 [Panicum miliaceum]|uniref:BTB domain-containing protein n=1 Tax=Panicum miliaceum TaxID=4540 RepID=A0A3L6RIU7_PANMI|nr:hypothetical protein C2845_PM13G07030 [Panicum miliaceum]